MSTLRDLIDEAIREELTGCDVELDDQTIRAIASNVAFAIILTETDEHDDYTSGAVDCLDHCEHQARIAAFGAIRRAAAIARRLEALSEAEGDAWALRADAARLTIRAALKDIE